MSLLLPVMFSCAGPDIGEQVEDFLQLRIESLCLCTSGPNPTDSCVARNVARIDPPTVAACVQDLHDGAREVDQRTMGCILDRAIAYWDCIARYPPEDWCFEEAIQNQCTAQANAMLCFGAYEPRVVDEWEACFEGL